MTLVNGNIVNDTDEIVGTYYKVRNNFYSVKLYGSYATMTQIELENTLSTMDLYPESIWN